MQNIIFGLASFVVAAFAFGYGASKLFKMTRSSLAGHRLLTKSLFCRALIKLHKGDGRVCLPPDAVGV